MPNARHALLQERLDDHQAAVRGFIHRAQTLAGDQWLRPRAAGKWTPAQETRHVILTYEAFMRDLNDVERIRLRGTRFRRFIWKAIGLTAILWKGRIIRAVRAPRVTTPEVESAPASELLPALQECATRFESVFSEKWVREPERRISHPFFGLITLDQSIRLAAVHTRHHAALLPAASTLHGGSHATPDLVDASPRRGAGVR